MIQSRKITLSLLLLLPSIGYSIGEKDSIKTQFNTKNGFDKVIFYEKLNLNDKRTYKDFFYQNFPRLLSEEKIKSNKPNLIKLKFALAEIYNIKGNEIKAIEVLIL